MTTRKELLQRAEYLVPTLRERAAETEERRQALPETIEDLKSAQLITVAQPQRYGGTGLDFDIVSKLPPSWVGAAAPPPGVTASGPATTGWWACSRKRPRTNIGLKTPTPFLPLPLIRHGARPPETRAVFAFPAIGISPAVATRPNGSCSSPTAPKFP